MSVIELPQGRGLVDPVGLQSCVVQPNADEKSKGDSPWVVEIEWHKKNKPQWILCATKEEAKEIVDFLLQNLKKTHPGAAAGKPRHGAPALPGKRGF